MAFSLACDLAPKLFRSVINGLIKSTVFGDEAVTHKVIVDNLFGSSAMQPAGTLSGRGRGLRSV